jgi:hypothetical protein
LERCQPSAAGDPALLDELPHLAGLLTQAPIRLQQQLYDAFGLQLLYSKKHHRVTIRATITRTTPATVEAIAGFPSNRGDFGCGDHG